MRQKLRLRKLKCKQIRSEKREQDARNEGCCRGCEPDACTRGWQIEIVQVNRLLCEVEHFDDVSSERADLGVHQELSVSKLDVVRWVSRLVRLEFTSHVCLDLDASDCCLSVDPLLLAKLFGERLHDHVVVRGSQGTLGIPVGCVRVVLCHRLQIEEHGSLRVVYRV